VLNGPAAGGEAQQFAQARYFFIFFCIFRVELDPISIPRAITHHRRNAQRLTRIRRSELHPQSLAESGFHADENCQAAFTHFVAASVHDQYFALALGDDTYRDVELKSGPTAFGSEALGTLMSDLGGHGGMVRRLRTGE
jgi:hypothetical protein